MTTAVIGWFRFLRERDVSGRQALCARSERNAALHTLLEILSTGIAVRDGVWRRRTDLLKPLCTWTPHLSRRTTNTTRVPWQLSTYVCITLLLSRPLSTMKHTLATCLALNSTNWTKQETILMTKIIIMTTTETNRRNKTPYAKGAQNTSSNGASEDCRSSCTQLASVQYTNEQNLLFHRDVSVLCVL